MKAWRDSPCVKVSESTPSSGRSYRFIYIDAIHLDIDGDHHDHDDDTLVWRVR
jgi:hypothetical protein